MNGLTTSISPSSTYTKRFAFSPCCTMIVPLGYVTTFPAARNASTCERESGVRIIWRRSSPIVSTQAPQVGSLRILHGRISPLPMWSERIPQSRARRTRAQPLRDGTDGKAVAREREPSVRSGCSE